MQPECYSERELKLMFGPVARNDNDLSGIIEQYGYPPDWTRPNSFETLVLTILEQQVSLASAYAAYKKLKERVPFIPAMVLKLRDEELKSCYVSRQKIIYIRQLADAIASDTINLKKFETQPDDAVRTELKKLKGIGDWTVDIYLIHALRRKDIFPTGDLALVNSIKMVLKKESINKKELLNISEQWKPYRSFATMLFWHYYIRKKGIRILH